MSSLLSYDERVVLSYVLTEGRVNFSKLGRTLGRSRQLVYYWVRRMLEMGILGPPQVYVRPDVVGLYYCLLYTSPSPRDRQKSRMPSSA